MLLWEKRPREIANLFNPPFCSILIHNSILGFQKENDRGMPYPILFMILPLVLHKSTREKLPKRISSKMHVWLQNNPEVRIDFADHTHYLVPYTKEALIFGLHKEIFYIEENGNFMAVQKRLNVSSWIRDSEPDTLRKRALFLGRWFAHAGDVATIFAMWGIRP